MLEVIALSRRDAELAAVGGAQRIELVSAMEKDGLSPAPELVEEIVNTVPIRVRAMVRLESGFQTARLPELAQSIIDFRNAGAEGVVFGYVNSAGRLDRRVMNELIGALDEQGTYTVHRAVDHCADYLQAISDTLDLEPAPSVILTAGSARGVTDGLRNLAAAITRYPHVLSMMQVGGGLELAHVPMLRSLGVTMFHVGSGVRENGTFDSDISPAKVREWLEAIS